MQNHSVNASVAALNFQCRMGGGEGREMPILKVMDDYLR